MSAAIEKTDADRSFEFRDHLGYDRLGDREVFRSLRHAAPLDDRYEDVQMPQLYALNDLCGR
jgi:hypothetical protein